MAQQTNRVKRGPYIFCGRGKLPLTGAAQADTRGALHKLMGLGESLRLVATTSSSSDLDLGGRSFSGRWSLTVRAFLPTLAGALTL